MRKTVDKQRKAAGKRDPRGRFAKGNTAGFQPGQSGNPKGRPKCLTLSEAMRNELAKLQPGTEQTYAEIIAAKLVHHAAMGSVMAAKEIADRTEGKPRQALDVDMQLRDWREQAAIYGVSEEDVIAEAKRLIESADD